MSFDPKMSSDPAEARLLAIRRLIASKRLQEAAIQSDHFIASFPQHAGALIQRSRLESLRGQHQAASDYALRAYGAEHGSLRDTSGLLKRLGHFGLYRELDQLLDRLPSSLLANPELAALAMTMAGLLQDPDKMLRFAELGLRSAPENIPLQMGKGQALMFLGQLDEAELHLLDCLKKLPGLAFAWWMLARLRKQTHQTNHVTRLREELREAVHPQDITFLAYALHKELDDLGDAAGASVALEQANKSMRSLVDYSPEADGVLFQALKNMPAGDVAETSANAVDAGLPVPIFIVGMHRSGTTLLEQFLDGHPSISCAGELYDFTVQMRYAANHHCSREIDLEIISAVPHIDFRAVGKRYLQSASRHHHRGSHLTDKLPSNFLNIGFILRALPQARILHMVRDPAETCFSNLREYFSETAGLYSYDQLEMAGYYGEYASLMEHWHRTYPGRILDINYTDLVQDSEQTLRKAMHFCGLNFVPDMLDTSARSRSVTTASAVQVRNKPSLPPTPKWHAYRDYLAPMISALPPSA